MTSELTDSFHMMWNKLDRWGNHLIMMLPNILIALLILVITVLVARLARQLVTKFLTRFSHSIALNNLITSLVYIIALVMGLFFALGVLGLDKTVTSMLAGVGIIGLALGFAFQDLAANFISGVIIAIRKPFNVGDDIESNGHTGTIEALNLRTVDIRKFTGELVIIPNKKVFEEPLINYSHYGISRIELSIRVGFDCDLEFVRNLVQECLREVPGIVKNKEPLALYDQFEESYVKLRVWLWIDSTKSKEYREAKSNAIMLIKKAYDANGLEFPLPTRTMEFKDLEKLADARGRAQPKGTEKKSSE
jgi:small conductance mechanosensitive channel